MSIKNILIVTAFMSLQNHNLVRAETIRDMDIPNLNVTGILGNWYVLASATKDVDITCTTMSFKQQSEDNFTMNSTFIMSSESFYVTYSLVFDCTLDEDSNIITCDKDVLGELLIALVFDVDYNSYLAMYTTDTTEKVYSGADGYVFILGREKTLPGGVLEQVKQSNFYKEGMKPGDDLELLETSGCQ